MRPQSKYRMFVAGLVAILCTYPLVASSALQDFYDVKISRWAAEDISKMDRQEIEVFISFLAAYRNRGGSLADSNCNLARETYLIKYARGRSIDQITNLLGVFGHFIESSGKTAKPGSKEMKDLIKMLNRQQEIIEELRSATRLRFQSLAKIS